MPVAGQQLDGLCYVAWNTAANVGQTGDASNHVLRLVRDGVEIVPAGAPIEVDATNCKGLYKLNLSAAEMSGNVVTLAGKSLTANVIIVPVQLTTQAAAAIASTSSTSGQIWTDVQLAQWSADAISQIAIDVPCIFVRECIATESGRSVYTLPSYVRTVRRVQWRGIGVTNVSWEELQLLAPMSTFVSVGSGSNIEDPIGKPQYYAMHPTNPYDIRFYPTPNETFTTAGEPNPYAPTVNSPSCIVEFWREPDTTNTVPAISLPAYITRRTQKAFVCASAFNAEGKGQSAQAANFYLQKYQFLISQFRRINEGCFVAKRYSLGDGTWPDAARPGRPSLPSNFEFVRLH